MDKKRKADLEFITALVEAGLSTTGLNDYVTVREDSDEDYAVSINDGWFEIIPVGNSWQIYEAILTNINIFRFPSCSWCMVGFPTTALDAAEKAVLLVVQHYVRNAIDDKALELDGERN